MKSTKLLTLLKHYNSPPIPNKYTQHFVSIIQSPLHNHLLIHTPNPNFTVHKRWHGGHVHRDHRRRSEEGEKIFRLGLAADIGLAAGKALTGYVSGSTAIIADAAHSLSDVVLSGVALLSYKAAMVPKDKEHPYGHGKFESLGALGISSVLLATGGVIAWHTFDILVGLLAAAPQLIDPSAHPHMHTHSYGGHHHGIDMSHPILALSTMVVSISVKEGLYWITKRAGERSGSGLMKANAWHHRADAVSSIVALIGVGGSIVGVKFLDPLAGLVVSGMIFKAGLETGYASVLELVDAAIPAQLLDPYRQTIKQVEEVKGCNHLRGRRAGSSMHLDVNIEVVDPFSSVSVAHEVEENVRRAILESHPEVAEVFIHIEPWLSNIMLDVKDQQNDMKGSYHLKSSVSSKDKDIEDIIYGLLAAKYAEQMVVERITSHILQGKTLIQVEVSMPPDVLIRDAINLAKYAQRHIKPAVSDAVQVCFQLQLGSAITESNSEMCDDNKEEK
ncbi:metal tolerance protein 2 [Heracleum sosnowskyi]|uniref:Metal tolerance protein 2 n=1 Tax=Heracleum sosnowskyi TaxID=360622 RepID=A0AAD8GS32_9APIA|nr:metal tolerance protein 2 [Heracleum sosnowskyi]